MAWNSRFILLHQKQFNQDKVLLMIGWCLDRIPVHTTKQLFDLSTALLTLCWSVALWFLCSVYLIGFSQVHIFKSVNLVNIKVLHADACNCLSRFQMIITEYNIHNIQHSIEHCALAENYNSLVFPAMLSMWNTCILIYLSYKLLSMSMSPLKKKKIINYIYNTYYICIYSVCR